MSLTEDARAKINLHLHVVGRRDDGYHLLDSLVVFAEVGDRLTVTPARDLSLDITGPFAAGLRAEPDNLVLRAARWLAAEVGIAPYGHLILDKHLPVSSGIGGGSADAAAALRLLSRLWRIDPAPDRLNPIAERLGADVPVCLLNRPARLAGIGEQLRPAPALPPMGIVLVNPGVAVSTPAVFKLRSGAFSADAVLPSGWPDAAALAATLRTTRNDLQSAACVVAPVIAQVLDALAADPACLLARMSGSGATCFGLYGSAAAARLAADGLGRLGWWVWGGGASSSCSTLT
jgi:4-diphosphocytidyl-2-C-methyl-D-erythritol kinase